MTDAAPSSRPPCTREDALAVLKRLRESGHEAYFAGGCVRDLLLGIEPKDWDIATDAPPPRVRELFSNTQAVGAAFGVILVRHRRSVVEVATFRAEGPYLDGRHPSKVTFTTAEQDAQRRDFTINGLFLDPLDDRVIDYVGGQEDLKAKRIRAIGDPNARFEEDHLRMLRAVRFAARFGFTIEQETARAIESHAEQLKRISPERIAEELRLMLTPPTRVAAWRTLWELRLLNVILRGLYEDSCWPPYKDRYTRAIFPNIAPDEWISFGLALAAMVLCYRRNTRDLPSIESLVTREQIQRAVKVCRRGLRISNEEADAMEGAMDVSALLQADPPRVATMKRFLAGSHSRDARRLLDAMLRAGETPRIAWLAKQFAELEKSDVSPPPLITGDDLIAQGLQPGRAFKKILDAVYDAQIEDRVRTKEEAMELALALARQP